MDVSNEQESRQTSRGRRRSRPSTRKAANPPAKCHAPTRRDATRNPGSPPPVAESPSTPAPPPVPGRPHTGTRRERQEGCTAARKHVRRDATRMMARLSGHGNVHCEMSTSLVRPRDPGINFHPSARHGHCCVSGWIRHIITFTAPFPDSAPLPDPSWMKDLLIGLVAMLPPPTFLIIDALDECLAIARGFLFDFLEQGCAICPARMTIEDLVTAGRTSPGTIRFYLKENEVPKPLTELYLRGFQNVTAGNDTSKWLLGRCLELAAVC